MTLTLLYGMRRLVCEQPHPVSRLRIEFTRPEKDSITCRERSRVQVVRRLVCMGAGHDSDIAEVVTEARFQELACPNVERHSRRCQNVRVR
jgi:hypothetical protein